VRNGSTVGAEPVVAVATCRGRVGRRIIVAVLAAFLATAMGSVRPAAADEQAEAADQKPVKGIPAIFAMDPDGSNPRPLVKLPGMRWHGSPTWSRDGKMVAFDATSGAFPAAHLYVYVVKGPFKGMLRDMGQGQFPAFSPDDRTIAFGGGGDPNAPQPNAAQPNVPGVWLMDSDGTNRRRLCDGDHPKWSPDGKRLAVTHEDERPGTIDIVTAETGKSVRVLTSEYASIHGAVFSPDGKKLAFIGYIDQQMSAGELVTMNADGAPETRKVVMRGRIGWVPNWSPDGKQLTFVLWTKKMGVDIDTNYVLDADGQGVPVKLKNQDVGTRNVEMEWSPDGKTAVSASDRELGGQLKIVRAEEMKVEFVPDAK
jgi:Tol biopolymer transport system component